MTFAWYGHLKISQRTPVQGDPAQLDDRVLRILLPGFPNRIGSYEFTAAQLKTIQGVITLVFFPFSRFFIRSGRFDGTTSPASE
jgi:uncharacterized protein (DUF486 family)